MSEKTDQPTRTFSIHEASALLPLVRPIAAEWRTLTNDAVYRQELLGGLPGQGAENGDDSVYGEERAASRSSVDGALRRVEELRGELLRMGLVPQDAARGHLLFPSADRESGAFLSWLPEDESAAHVLDAVEGPARRRPLRGMGEREAFDFRGAPTRRAEG